MTTLLERLCDSLGGIEVFQERNEKKLIISFFADFFSSLARPSIAVVDNDCVWILPNLNFFAF
jgi:hypothetical protein